MNFIQTSASTFVAHNDAKWQGALVTTIVGVTDTGMIYEATRMDNGPWSEWSVVAPKLTNQSAEGHPLQCTFKDDILSITLDAETLKCATENHPTLGVDPDSGYIVEDEKTYAAEVVKSLNNEREDGSTLVTDMIDAAIEHAIENGCEGIKHD